MKNLLSKTLGLLVALFLLFNIGVILNNSNKSYDGFNIMAQSISTKNCWDKVTFGASNDIKVFCEETINGQIEKCKSGFVTSWDGLNTCTPNPF